MWTIAQNFIFGTATARAIGIVLAVALYTGLVYRTGVNAERRSGELASARAELAGVRKDLSIARQSVDDADQRSAAIEGVAKSNEEKVHDLERELAEADSKAPEKPDSCGPAVDRLSESDAVRLRNIR